MENKMNVRKPVCLIIRDGWGKGEKENSNALYVARTPFTDQAEAQYPGTIVQTSGLHVGLPAGYQGNSEVGHLNIGAGRVVYQSLTRIDKAIEDGDFFENEALLEAIKTAKKRGARVHLLGLIQEEGVHAVTRHCHRILEMCKQQGMADVLVHAITDGRDTPPKSTKEHMSFLQEGLDKTGTGRIATVTGRYYAMDRDKRWDRTQLAYEALMYGKGKSAANWQAAVADAYENDETDEFIKPRIIDYSGMAADDTVIFFNFRFDRTRQLTKALAETDFSFFETGHTVDLTAMTHYYDDGSFIEAFPELEYKNILGEVLANNGLKQLRAAETEKYAHVTFFFNALQNDPFEGEDRILVDSPKVATYDLKPEMSAFEVRDKLVEAINTGKYDCVICNFANCDMVGHTGIFDAVIKAVKTVDSCVQDVVEAVLGRGGVCILTADHGNAEQTQLEDGSPMTAHTTNPVPLTLVGAGDTKLRENGKLSDIAPTMLKLLGIKQPAEMTGESLV
ncbi:MAG: 2,3-bisphosphoglycerate-independent phosphoglycerate mutase [bacterium]|nr:2,3-bisphosphoglycerate-independent phosphoglycerate mutase [bacterium]